jgi:hypothetical protein
MDGSAFCEDWWEITDPMKFSLHKIKFFFLDEELKKQIDVAQKLEIVTISLIQFMGHSADKSLNVPLKNLMFYVH